MLAEPPITAVPSGFGVGGGGAVIFDITCEPESDFVPLQLPEALHVVAFADVQERVTDPPEATVTGPSVLLTFKLTVGVAGAGVGVGVGVGVVLDGADVSAIDIPLAAQNQSAVLVQIN